MSNNVDLEKLKPFYAELKGYMSQAPTREENFGQDDLYNKHLVDQFNELVKSISSTAEVDFSRFMISISTKQISAYEEASHCFSISVYRQKLAGLLSALHAAYFANESNPIAESGSETEINVNQNQSVDVRIQLVIDLTSHIEKKIAEVPEGSKEKKFLEKFKGTMSSVKNGVDVISKAANLAKEYGLSPDELAGLF